MSTEDKKIQEKISQEEKIDPINLSQNYEKNFDLGSVLSVTTGRLFTELEKVYDILSYLSNSEVYTHQIPRLMNVSQSYVLKKLPQLKGVGQNIVINSAEDVKAILNSLEAVFGNSFTLSPMPKEMCEYIDPIEEAKELILSRTR